MVIEEYLNVTFPYGDMILRYSEALALACAGAGLCALIKKSYNSEGSLDF